MFHNMIAKLGPGFIACALLGTVGASVARADHHYRARSAYRVIYDVPTIVYVAPQIIPVEPAYYHRVYVYDDYKPHRLLRSVLGHPYRHLRRAYRNIRRHHAHRRFRVYRVDGHRHRRWSFAFRFDD